MFSSEFLGPYLASNIISAALVLAAVNEPEAYLVHADMAVLDIYRNVITGFFSSHTEIIILAIALGQLGVAVLLCCDNRFLKIGVGAGVLFFVAIIPLGVGSAFPAPLLLAFAIVLMWRRLVRDT